MLLWNLIFSQSFPDQLVKYGLFRRIEVCRLPNGHTHEDIDALFDVLRRESRHKTLITPQDWKDMAIAAFSLDFVSVAWNRPSASVGANLSKSFWQKCKSVFWKLIKNVTSTCELPCLRIISVTEREKFCATQPTSRLLSYKTKSKAAPKPKPNLPEPISPALKLQSANFT